VGNLQGWGNLLFLHTLRSLGQASGELAKQVEFRLMIAAFFESCDLHLELSKTVQAHGVTSLEQLAAMGPEALEEACVQSAKLMASQLSARLSELQFLSPPIRARRTGNRRDFMVALAEMIGDPAADPRQRSKLFDDEVQLLFDRNAGHITDGWGNVCHSPTELWCGFDASAYPGMQLRENRVLQLLKYGAKPLAASIAQKQAVFANILHQGYSFLASRGRAAPATLDLYCPLGSFFTSLQAQDAGWAAVLEPDETGFRGFVSFAPTSLTDWPDQCWCAHGFLFGGGIGAAGGGESTDSPVVRVRSAPADDRGLHTAVKLHDATLLLHGTFRLFALLACSCNLFLRSI
jgi:hypothetical protein